MTRWWHILWWVFALVLVGTSVHAQGPVIAPPVPIEMPTAVLPEGTALEDHDVILMLTIGADGLVSDVAITSGVGAPWDDAAVAAAKRFRFKPATSDSQPLAVSVPFTYAFRAPTPTPAPEPTPTPAPEPAPDARCFAGELVEKGTRAPQAGVPVLVTDPRSSSNWETLTEADGRFLFCNLPPGKLNLEVFTANYDPFDARITVAATTEVEARNNAKRYYLTPSGNEAYRTSVHEQRAPDAASEIKLQNEELTKVPGTFGDPTRVVASLPGVARSTFGLGYYVVRGAETENTGFFIDGHPAGYLYHLFGGPGVVHPALIGSLSFYPGGYPARYGRVAAGVIALETQDPPRDRWHFDLEVDLFKAAALFSVPFDDERGVATFSFRRSYYEALLPSFTDALMLGYNDYQARVAYTISPRVRARFVALGAIDYVDINQSEDTEGGSDNSTISVGFHRLNLAVDVDLSPCLTLTTSALAEYDYSDFFNEATGDATLSANTDGWVFQLISTLRWKAAHGVVIEGGLDLLQNDFQASFALPTSTLLGDPQAPAFDPIVTASRVSSPYLGIAPFVSADITIGTLRLLPGLRLNLDDYGDHFEPTLDPKLAVRWQLAPTFTLKAMGALAHQAPQVSERIEPFGNPDLPPVQGTQASLGFEWVPASGWLVSLEGFGQWLDHLTGPATDNSVDGSQVGSSNIDDNVDGRAFGLELLVRKDFGEAIYGWLSYTLSRSERLRPGRDWTLFESDQTHVLNFAWTVRLGNDWQLGARFQLTSGNPYYPIIDARYDVDSDTHTPIYSATQSRLRVYHRLDLRVDKTWRFDTWMFELYLDIQNVYNASNPESPTYSFDYRQRGGGASLPFLPTLGFRMVF